MFGYAVPPLETAGTVVLMFLTDTIASLAAAIVWLTSGFSSFGSASSGLSSSGYSSSVGTGSGGNLTVPEMEGKQGV